MNKFFWVLVLLSVVLAGCNDKRSSAQQAFDKDVLALSATIWAAGDMTRKSEMLQTLLNKNSMLTKGRNWKNGHAQ
jgi:hypothetical protein